MEVLKAENWMGQNPAGWWMSEKLDGIRAYWDGEKLISRSGNKFNAPDWFLKTFPAEHLDGELWIDRKSFGNTLSAVSKKVPKKYEWMRVRYMAFDAPELDAPFEMRLLRVIELVQQAQGQDPKSPLRVLHHEQCRDREHMDQFHEAIAKLGGEGTMLRKAGSNYVRKRSSTLLKRKDFHDAEAVVIGYNKSDNREYRSLLCKLVSNPDIEFDVGSGLSYQELQNPPSVGTVITFRYLEFMESGKPRHPSFVRIRKDV